MLTNTIRVTCDGPDYGPYILNRSLEDHTQDKLEFPAPKAPLTALDEFRRRGWREHRLTIGEQTTILHFCPKCSIALSTIYPPQKKGQLMSSGE